jgi:hypothetical protein
MGSSDGERISRRVIHESAGPEGRRSCWNQEAGKQEMGIEKWKIGNEDLCCSDGGKWFGVPIVMNQRAGHGVRLAAGQRESQAIYDLMCQYRDQIQ